MYSEIRRYSNIHGYGRDDRDPANTLYAGQATLKAFDGSIYYFGGFSSSANYDVYKFDILSSTVATAGTLPVTATMGERL